MKVVQTTEFEVLGPLTYENYQDIEKRIQAHVNVDHKIPEVIVANGFYVLLGEDHTARPVHPSDFEAQYETVEGNALDRLEEEFDMTALVQQGEMHTEEVWQFFEPYTTVQGETIERWWDGEDEQNARIRTNNGQVRMRRDISVNGPWKYFEVKS